MVSTNDRPSDGDGAPPGPASDLWARLGGSDGIAGAVADLYDRILGDDELAPFFAGVDVHSVQRHQRELVTTAVGGPSSYVGRSLQDAHRGLQIERHHVDLVVGHLAAALQRSGVAPSDVDTVVGLVERMWTAQFWPV